ncbi:Heterotrimeric G-protein alpha subunit 4 [Mycena indigotica]|uniref:Heterotrimeric G-protein alpha subunit 4 n=1 Tax=Mycena indigotica TaxID=2126181 RepID=A0A8H6WF61_9AGAR|nr:Heterotrimeric G-protein alpha subunit 4 [Mycena indigotica]KAF7310194.1 Heterotrimeric G-protein alpha subunit 4 [Mycena indigotica]
MGACMSGGVMVTDKDRQLHRDAEKELKATKAKMDRETKVLLLGAGDGGKSTIQKQMRIIHNVPFSAEETEHFRQLVFDNLTRGLKTLLDALPDLRLDLIPESGYSEVYPDGDEEGRAGYVRHWGPGEFGGTVIASTYKERMVVQGLETSSIKDGRGVSRDDLVADLALIENAPDLRDGEEFPLEYLGALSRLWRDPIVKEAWAKGNQAALPENLSYIFTALPRLFAPGYTPSTQDILHTRARTIGITETRFRLGEKDMIMVDVGGQKSERRKWIHCFQDVTSILFVVSLSGYDQCMVEDRSANQMQDAITIWESICHSKWFKETSVILFLNKDDIFRQKIKSSPLKKHFPEYDGPERNAEAGREFFKIKFARLARKGRGKEREVYVHVTTATDTAMLTIVMAAVTA